MPSPSVRSSDTRPEDGLIFSHHRLGASTTPCPAASNDLIDDLRQEARQGWDHEGHSVAD